MEVSIHSVPLTIWWEACGFAKLPPHAEHGGKGWVASYPGCGAAHERPRHLRLVRPRSVRGGRNDQQRLPVVQHGLRAVQPRRPDPAPHARLRDDPQDRWHRLELGRPRALHPAPPERRRGRSLPRGDRLHLRPEDRGAPGRRPQAGVPKGSHPGQPRARRRAGAGERLAAQDDADGAGSSRRCLPPVGDRAPRADGGPVSRAPARLLLRHG